MLQALIKKSKSVTIVTLAGNLEEDAGKSLAETVPRLAGQEVEFDCERLGQVNSIGFRQWIQYLRKLDEAGAKYTFANCPPSFLEYASLVAKISSADCIVSVMVPFHCEGCAKERLVSFEVDAIVPGEEIDAMVCPSCNGLCEAQISTAELLAFRESD